jgi:hypothetical protein
VTRESDALDLDRGVFTKRDPKRIAASLKRSAEPSRRRKADQYRSALSMLTFYINRAGKNLPASRRRTLEHAKGELRNSLAVSNLSAPGVCALLPKARLRYAGCKRGRSSVVERQLPKLYVEGSIPFARSNFLSKSSGLPASQQSYVPDVPHGVP